MFLFCVIMSTQFIVQLVLENGRKLVLCAVIYYAIKSTSNTLKLFIP